jgi:DNA-binding GntR family transcriptional regulator
MGGVPQQAPVEKAVHDEEPAKQGHVSQVSKAYSQLRELIIHGRLAPGTRIVEVDLANRLGVSRTPVRDALRLLQQEGFVAASSPGSFKARLIVAPLTKEDAEEVYGIVGRLEGWAARLSAQLPAERRTELAHQLRELNDGLRAIAAAAVRDPQQTLALDMEFHRRMVEASAGPRLLAIYNGIKPQTERYWRVYSHVQMHVDRSADEHAQIIRGIEAGDPDLAERGVVMNWQQGWERLCEVIDRIGERGSW